VGEVRENDVADLTGCPVLSTTQPATEHQPHGDSAPGEKAQHVLAPAGRTEPLFGQGSQPDVVLDSGDAAELTLQRSRQVPTGPLGEHARVENPAVVAYQPGHRHRHAEDLLSRNITGSQSLPDHRDHGLEALITLA